MLIDVILPERHDVVIVGKHSVIQTGVLVHRIDLLERRGGTRRHWGGRWLDGDTRLRIVAAAMDGRWRDGAENLDTSKTLGRVGEPPNKSLEGVKPPTGCSGLN